MFKQWITIFLLLIVGVLANKICSKERERLVAYLDTAETSISKARENLPDCGDNIVCPELKAVDCADWYNRGYRKSGVYTIWPVSRLTENKSLDVYCDMDTDGGGWLVIQRRGNFGNPNDYFFKDWASYKDGFGNIQKDFWLGNDHIFALTNQKLYSIRFDLVDNDLKKVYAKYAQFWISDEVSKYTLSISNYSGNAGDGMREHNNQKFSTKDNDASKDCASSLKGAWWYNACYTVNLNGLYNDSGNWGIKWYTWSKPNSMIWTEMKIRPVT